MGHLALLPDPLVCVVALVGALGTEVADPPRTPDAGVAPALLRAGDPDSVRGDGPAGQYRAAGLVLPTPAGWPPAVTAHLPELMDTHNGVTFVSERGWCSC
jgi:hypothetical protein